MLAISFRFPAGGRYHATAWGTHANEGVPEWPPSPWRILRALIATARWKSGGSTAEDPPGLRELVEALAAAPPPSFHLPAAAAAHTRHYMPLGNDTTTKIFDTFVQPAGEMPLVVRWDAALDPASLALLAALLGKMNYFGRAESLCEAELLPDEAVPGAPDSYPLNEGQSPNANQQTVRLLAPVPPDAFLEWRSQREGSATGTAKGKPKSSRARKSSTPVDLFAALHLDTADWRGAGWSLPPGSRWVEYVRPSAPFKLSAPPQRRRRFVHPGIPGPAVARYELQAPVMESVAKALSLGERLRVKLAASSAKAPVFTGKDESGVPLSGRRHAYFLPECDHRGLLKRLTIYAEMGFSPEAVDALKSLRDTWSMDNPGLKVMLLGFGPAADFTGISALGEACEWISRTPFIPVRYIKRTRSGKPKTDPADGLVVGSAEHDLRRLLMENGFPEPVQIQPCEALELEGRRIRWANFQRDIRRGEGTGIESRTPYGFRIIFPKPVLGPLALGYGSHLGLGLFVPVPS